MTKRFSVSLEICHIENREKAEVIAKEIEIRLSDFNEDVYVCIADYQQVKRRTISEAILGCPGWGEPSLNLKG